MQLCITIPSVLFSCYDINEIRHISTKTKGSDCMKRSKTYLKCLALSAVVASSALALSTPAAYAQNDVTSCNRYRAKCKNTYEL